MGRNKSIVTVLRSIATGNQKRLFLDCLVVYQQFVGLRTVAKILLNGILYIGDGPTSFLGGELLTYRCVESYTAGAEKDTLVRTAAIDSGYISLQNNFKRFF